MRPAGLGVIVAIGIGVAVAVGRSGAPGAAQASPPAGDVQATALATFAGGCFWCMEGPFEDLPGVASVISGYAGGSRKDPTYEEVSSGTTGHTESVQVHYDPRKVTYDRLLEVFWRNVDPLTPNAQFCDHGSQYRSAIFFHDEAQRAAVEASKRKVEERFPGQKVVTEVVPAAAFYPAEEYHQDFHHKNPVRYQTYRMGCGRDRRLKQLWGDEAGGKKVKPAAYEKPSDQELKNRLSPIQYQVTQHEGTEPPFRNEYWDNHRPGLYVDVVSGEPLFSSRDKFDSGTGWPSFSRPVNPKNVRTRTDYKLVVPRTEARSARADSHLGHVFDDGPPPTGLRYCINSAALRFVPAEELASQGYEEYSSLFGSAAAHP